MNDIYYSAGWNSLFSMFVTLGLIVVAWVLMKELRWDKIFRHPQSPGARLLQLLLAIIVGHGVAGFVMDYWNWTSSLRWLFGSG